MNTNDDPTGAVTISGTATQGEVLTAVSTLADADGLGTLTYQWSAGGVAISEATSSTLTIGDSQVGKEITVTVSYTDGGGTVETETSEATPTVSLPPLFDITIGSQSGSIVTFDLVTSDRADPSNDGVDSFELVLTYDKDVFEYDSFSAAVGVTAVPNATQAGSISTAAFAFPAFSNLDDAIASIDLKILDTSAPSTISLSSLVNDNGVLTTTNDFDFDFDNDLLIMADIV